MHITGIPVDCTEEALFDCLSRTLRFALASYAGSIICETEIWCVLEYLVVVSLYVSLVFAKALRSALRETGYFSTYPATTSQLPAVLACLCSERYMDFCKNGATR